MNQNIIKTLSGSVNLLKSSAKACIFHAPKKGGKGSVEIFLDKAARSGITGGPDGVVNRIGLPNYMQSVPGTVPEISGQMIEQSFAIAEGEIIKVFISVRSGWGKLPRSGNVFLRVRSEAAYQLLTFEMISHPDVAFTHARVEGNFDVLTLEEALAFGVHIPVAYRSMCEQHNVDRILTDRVIVHEAVSSAPKFTQKVISDGEVSRTITVRKRRRVIE